MNHTFEEMGEVSPALEEFRRRTLIADQYREAFFKLPERDQLKELVRRAVIDVYGSSWTTPDSREVIAEAAARSYDDWNAKLQAAAEIAALAGEVEDLQKRLARLENEHAIHYPQPGPLR